MLIEMSYEPCGCDGMLSWLNRRLSVPSACSKLHGGEIVVDDLTDKGSVALECYDETIVSTNLYGFEHLASVSL